MTLLSLSHRLGIWPAASSTATSERWLTLDLDTHLIDVATAPVEHFQVGRAQAEGRVHGEADVEARAGGTPQGWATSAWSRCTCGTTHEVSSARW